MGRRRRALLPGVGHGVNLGGLGSLSAFREPRSRPDRVSYGPFSRVHAAPSTWTRREAEELNDGLAEEDAALTEDAAAAALDVDDAPVPPLTPPISAHRLPRHLGLIMDGNGRWATERGLRGPAAGHRAGVMALRR